MYDKIRKIYDSGKDKASSISASARKTLEAMLKRPKKAAAVLGAAGMMALAPYSPAKQLALNEAYATPIITLADSDRLVGDFDPSNPGLEQHLSYAITNDSSIMDPDGWISSIRFDFGSDDGVYDASIDRVGWVAYIEPDSTLFTSGTGYSWKPGLDNLTVFHLYGSGTSIQQGGATAYTSLGYASNTAPVTGPAAPVPEPATILLSGIGLSALGAYLRKKKKA